MNHQEFVYVAQTLQEMLSNDNLVRNTGQEKLGTIKHNEPDKYTCYLIAILQQDEYSSEIKGFAAFILNRDISSTTTHSQDLVNQACNANLWSRLSADAKNFAKTELLKTIQSCTDKVIIRKICKLISEIVSTIDIQKEPVWQELLQILFNFLNSDSDIQVYAGLKIFDGNSYLAQHFVKCKEDLIKIFTRTLQHNTFVINLAALQAISEFVRIIKRKDSIYFLKILPLLMAQVAIKAFQAGDEVVLINVLGQFNCIANYEPKFFRKDFQELFTMFLPIVTKNDYANHTIRHQPIQFAVTVVKISPTILKEDQETLKVLLDLVFKLMIDIDEDVDESWMKPKDGFIIEDDSVEFSKVQVDQLLSCIGKETMLPLLSSLVTTTISNTEDWRYKNASLMVFSQVGKYIDDIQKIASMISVVVKHFAHPNPKIRYAALHCIGYIANDMTEKFQYNFHKTVLPALIQMLDDPVPRVQAHACDALTNFFQGAGEDILENYIDATISKLGGLIISGIIIVKEEAVVALATFIQSAKSKFVLYFEETFKCLYGFLVSFHEPQYKNFKAHVIESVTAIADSIGMELFRPHAPAVISALLEIQNKQLDSNDPQRTSLLSAWETICLLMKKEFTPFLAQVLSSVFEMVALNAEMSIQDNDIAGVIADALNVVESTDKNNNKRKFTITTDDIEEKDATVKMLAVFIEEFGSGFADWVEPTSRILIGLIQHEANDSIRNSVAGALLGLIKCVKEAQPQNEELLIDMGQTYIEAIREATDDEFKTDAKICQIQAVKEIICEVGDDIICGDFVDDLIDQLAFMGNISDRRIKYNNKMIKNDDREDEDYKLDNDELERIKKDNKNENDLQFLLAEINGIIFKLTGSFDETSPPIFSPTFLAQQFAEEKKERNEW